MSILFHPLKFTDIFSFGWSGIKLITDDYYRYYHRDEAIVRIKTGNVKGYRITSSYHYEYYNFLGIPYAKPPVAELRFKEPQPFEPTTNDGIINEKFARRGSVTCQPDLLMSKFAMGSEDCLHLSVFTHDIRPNTLRPCIVWIHGGGFTYGSNSKEMSNPEYLLRKNIVLIAINYRLGALGFLSLKDPQLGVPGNAGLKDQVMALKWVKENCMHFGGDPDNITIIGESAGSASVSMHMLSDQSKNLFHKAVMMSGTAFSPWSISANVSDWSQLLAKKLGWNGDGGEAACLRTLEKASTHAIIRAQDKLLTTEEHKLVKFIAFSPVLEPYETEQCFLRKLPSELISSAWSKHVPTIIGVCANEGLLFYKMLKNIPEIPKGFNALTAMANSEIDISSMPEDKREEITKQIESFYSEQPVAATAEATATVQSYGSPVAFDYFMVLHDKAFAHPIHRLIMAREKHQHAPTYLLRFDLESTYSLLKRTCVGERIPGVCHGDDLSYYFRTFHTAEPAHGTTEWKTIERMCEIISTFAADGDPNNQSIAPIQWSPCSIEIAPGDDQIDGNYKLLNVSNDVSYNDWIDLKRMQFWDKIYMQLGYKPY